jgi:hypothetical protein
MRPVAHVRIRIPRPLVSGTMRERGNALVRTRAQAYNSPEISRGGVIPHVRSLDLPPCDSSEDRCTARASRRLWNNLTTPEGANPETVILVGG